MSIQYVEYVYLEKGKKFRASKKVLERNVESVKAELPVTHENFRFFDKEIIEGPEGEYAFITEGKITNISQWY